MKAYTDLFNQPISKEDVKMAVVVVVRTDNPYPSNLQRRMKIGYAKAARLSKLLFDAGVTTDTSKTPRSVILKSEVQATNAALRQLKKGRR
jgi:DNA segregation ATPase FtsK/SpoIIIE-like protein